MKNTIRVLVIDDDEEDFMITRDIFKEIPDKNYTLDWVSSYLHGINEINKRQHDIYFVDYNLGVDEENGLNVIRESVKQGCVAPLIMLTGQNNPQVDVESMKSGAHDFLVKGQFSSHELERLIRYSLNHATNLEKIKDLNAELESRVEERTKVLNQTLCALEKSKAETEKTLVKERELNEMKSRFVTMASHEFRTPLSTILSSVDLIARYSEEENLDKRTKHMERIRVAVHHMTCLLEDFLSLGKLEGGAVTSHPVLFNLNEFGLQISSEMQLLASNNQIINYSYSGSNNLVFQDPKITKSILINLLSNAIKFSGNGKNIDFFIENKLDKVEFIIRDEGIGIPDSDQKHLLKSFFRASNAVNISGTGLGLNIVAGYVKMLGGEISFTSKIEVGTTFCLILPVEEKS